MQKVERQSNIELLRIILMFMIIVHHMIVHGLGLKFISETHYKAQDSLIYELLVNSFVVFAVNTFVFISSYFGVKLKLTTVISFILQALFYSAGIYLVFCAFKPEMWSINKLAFSFFPISRNIWWFLTAYLALLLISPLLNKGIAAIDKKQMLVITGSFIFLDCFSGFVFGTLSETGYTFFHFLTLYLIGQSMKRFLPDVKRPFPYFFILTTLLFVTGLMFFYFGKLSLLWPLFSYNNPVIVLAAILFFFTFKYIHFQNKNINRLSGAVFGVYLIHDHYLVRDALTLFVQQLRVLYSGSSLALALFLLALSILLFSLLIEMVRKYFFDKLLERIVDKLGVQKIFD